MWTHTRAHSSHAPKLGFFFVYTPLKCILKLRGCMLTDLITIKTDGLLLKRKKDPLDTSHCVYFPLGETMCVWERTVDYKAYISAPLDLCWRLWKLKCTRFLFLKIESKLSRFLEPEACWLSSLWTSGSVLNWASMKKLLSLCLEMFVGISLHHDPVTKV